MQLDDILSTIGEFGRYQKWLLFLICVSSIPDGFFLLDSVFLLGVPEHRCALPGYENDTFLIQDEIHRTLVDKVIPATFGESSTYDKCHVIKVRNLTESTEPGLQTNVTVIETCTTWVYDKTVFQETFVSKMDLVCDKSIWVANAGMSIYLGMLIGSLVGGIISDRFGRKVTLIICFGLRTTVSIVNCWSSNYTMFVVMQFLKGAAVIVRYLSGYVLVIEMIGSGQRVYAGLLMFASYSFGLLILGGLAYGLRHWFWIQLICAVPGVLFITYWWLLPESPRWLLIHNRRDEAMAVLIKMAKMNKTHLDKNLLQENLIISNASHSKRAGLLAIFSNRTLCFRSFLVFFSWMICSFLYFGLSLNSDNLGDDVYTNFAFLALVEFPAYIIAALIGDRVGRRKLFCLCMLVAGLACLSTLLTTQYAAHVPYLTIILASVGKLGVTMGFTVIYVYSAELFPTETRNAAMGLSSLFARTGVLIAPYLVVFGNAVGGPLGELLPLIIFGGTAILSACLVLLLPETLNKRLQDSVKEDDHTL